MSKIEVQELCTQERYVVLDGINEALGAVLSLNQLEWPTDRQLLWSITICDLHVEIKLGSLLIWDSSEDEREYTEDGEFEPIRDFLVREARSIATSIMSGLNGV